MTLGHFALSLSPSSPSQLPNISNAIATLQRCTLLAPPSSPPSQVRVFLLCRDVAGDAARSCVAVLRPGGLESCALDLSLSAEEEVALELEVVGGKVEGLQVDIVGYFQQCPGDEDEEEGYGMYGEDSEDSEDEGGGFFEFPGEDGSSSDSSGEQKGKLAAMFGKGGGKSPRVEMLDDDGNARAGSDSDGGPAGDPWKGRRKGGKGGGERGQRWQR